MYGESSFGLAPETVDSPSSLFNRAGIPVKIMMNHMPAIPMEVHTLSHNLTANQNIRKEGRIECEHQSTPELPFCRARTVWNEPTQERLTKIPRLYKTENTPLEEKLIYLDFFIAGCHWYIAEYDGEDLFWGFALLNNDYEMAEWGYVSFRELKEVTVDGCLEVDCELEESWKIRKASEIDKIRRAQDGSKRKKQPPAFQRNMN
jgi:hypothetical protein